MDGLDLLLACGIVFLALMLLESQIEKREAEERMENARRMVSEYNRMVPYSPVDSEHGEGGETQRAERK